MPPVYTLPSPTSGFPDDFWPRPLFWLSPHYFPLVNIYSSFNPHPILSPSGQPFLIFPPWSCLPSYTWKASCNSPVLHLSEQQFRIYMWGYWSPSLSDTTTQALLDGKHGLRASLWNRFSWGWMGEGVAPYEPISHDLFRDFIKWITLVYSQDIPTHLLQGAKSI